MKRLFFSVALIGMLSGCGCWDGGCAGYVHPATCTKTCSTCSTCSADAGYGYNDWY